MSRHRSPITDQWKAQAELALTYSEDGAFHTAANKMAELAEAMKTHANRVLGPEKKNG